MVLRHRPVGSVDRNRGLERRQAIEVARHLHRVVGIELPIEYRTGLSLVGTRVSIDVMAGLPDE